MYIEICFIWLQCASIVKLKHKINLFVLHMDNMDNRATNIYTFFFLQEAHPTKSLPFWLAKTEMWSDMTKNVKLNSISLGTDH